MGFAVGGLFGDQYAASTPAGASKAQKLKVTDAEKKFLDCSHCSLNHELKLKHPKMKPSGSSRPLVYMFSEAPGKKEDEDGRRFTGAAGDLLRKHLPEGFDDIAYADQFTRWDSVLRCHPPASRDPFPLEIECCRKLHVADIEATQPPVIMAFGRHALQWFMGTDKQMHVWRGRRAPVKMGTHTAWAYFIDDPLAVLHKMNDRKYGQTHATTFERDVQRVFKDIDKGLPAPYVEDPDYHKGVEVLSVYGADGLARIEQVLAQYADIEHGHDIETDRLRPYSPDARILSVAIGTYEHVLAYAWEHPEARWSAREHKQLREMHEAYLMGSGLKWAHEAKFEMEWWHSRFGPKVVYDTRWGDTLGQAHVIDEREGKGLDDLTQLHFGFNVKTLSPVDRKKLATTPLHYVLPYNALDTKYTHALSFVQSAILDELGLQSVYALLNSFTPSIVTMQAKGVVRNVPVIEQLDESLGKKDEAVKAKILMHKDVVAFRNTGHKFLPTSNQDLIVFFRDHLKIEQQRKKKGDTSYSVDDDALSNMRHPIAALISEMRTYQKHRGYTTPLMPGGKFVHADGLLHSSYSQYITASGRSSARDPSIQNFPRRGQEAKIIRRVVGCPPNTRFYSFDYGQLEWRIGAALSRDKRMIEELLDPKHDIHGRWTDALGRAFAPAMLKENRKGLRDALKNDWTFSNLYGNSPGAIAYMLSKIFARELRESELMPYYEEFWDTYPGLKKYQDRVMSTCAEEGYVETGTLQRRHEPVARNEGINHPFQGTAGHLVLDAQARVSRHAYESDRPTLQPHMNIHDDLSFYFPDVCAERDVEDVARFMLTGLFDFVDVPMLVECSVGENWADKTEIGSFTSKDFA